MLTSSGGKPRLPPILLFDEFSMKMNLMYSLCKLSALVVVLLFAGCEEKLNVTKVTGTVKMKGTNEPLEYIVVEFWPENGPTSRAKTDSSGNFTLRTMDASDMEGAMLGGHKVTFKDTWPMKDDVLLESGEWQDNSKGKKTRISVKYADPSKTPESVSVGEDQAPFEFLLDPAGR